MASTNLELDLGRVEPGFSLADHLIGAASGSGPVYLKSLLVSPEQTFGFELRVPAEPGLYGGLAGQQVPVIGFFFHPTSRDNDRPDYQIPGYEAALPRMAGEGQEPLWPGEPGPWPLLVFSHGLDFFPGELDELDYLARLASRGYLILALFHGDGGSPPIWRRAGPSSWPCGSRP